MTFEIRQYLYGLIAGVIIAYFCALLCVRLSGLLQQSGYSGGRFLKWYVRKGNIQRKRLSLLALSFVLLSALFALCFCFLPFAWANLISAVPVVAIGVVYFLSEKKFALKVKTVRTPRLIRLLAANGILVFALCCGAGSGLSAASLAVDRTWFYLLRFVPLAAFPLLCSFILVCSNFLMTLYEKPHNRHFIKRAKRTLQESRCVKVGVTGSFGKTSVKHYAAAMLSQKFSVIATPASYNTPMGIAKTVNGGGLDCDVFLAEMGARHKGDIAELCELVQPEYGVVTGVCPQHIETFGSLDAIKAEKGVLAARARKCVLGESAADLPAKEALREGKDFRVEELRLTAEGTDFALCLNGERVHISTSLLGRHAAEDVALAAALCSMLGMSAEEIARAAQQLQPVPHRLQKLEAGGKTILDDSYNSNIAGAKNAVETLRLFGGKKFIVTPGLVELGTLEEETNARLGAELVGLEVILVGETLVLPVRRGYLEAGGEAEHLRIVPTLEKAQEILAAEFSAGDCVLFLNDLPDIYA